MNNNALFHRRRRSMTTILPEATYFVVSLSANEKHQVQISTKTIWIGRTNGSPSRDLRTAGSVIPQNMLELWQEVEMPGVIVNCYEDLRIFLCMGGNAIVEESIARKHFSSIFDETEFVQTGLSTSTCIDNVDPSTLRRAPTPKLRMKILNRDSFRCRVCGRRAEDNTDIELHVHHFIPFAIGGLTEDYNLMTLCHTCHNGLDPHFEMSLAKVFPETDQRFNELVNNFDKFKQDYFEGVNRYREFVAQVQSQ